MVLTIASYKPKYKISDIPPGGSAHPAGSGGLEFDLRVMTRYGEVIIDFNGFQDLVSWNDTLSVEGASGSWTVRMRASLCNENLIKNLHPGMVIEAYCARNDDPLIGVNRDPSQITRIDTSPALPVFTSPPPTATSSNSFNVGTGGGGNPEANIQLILAECQKQGVTDPDQIAYILATAQHESRLTPIPEEDSGSQYEGRSDLGNTQSGDGSRYKGRGFVQLTGRTNYAKYSQLTGKDLVGNPDIALDPSVSAFVIVHGMKTGAFTGASLGQFIGGGKADFYSARTIVNSYDRADLIAGYAQEWRAKLPKYLGNQSPISTVQTDTGIKTVSVSPTADVIAPVVKPISDPYLDNCPYLLMRGIITDYGRSTSESGETVLTITGESFGKIYKDAFVLTDLNAPELASTSLEVRNSTAVPLGVSLIYYRLLKEWVENFWGSTTGWEARTRPIPFPPNYLTRVNSDGSVWSNLQYLAIDGFFHIFVDHTGAIVWEKLPWSSRSQSLIAGRNWEDLQLLQLPSWKILNWNDRVSQQGVTNFIRCVPTQQGMSGGQDPVALPALIYNIGSIRQYGGPNKREFQFLTGTAADEYYTSEPRRKQQATTNSFVSLCAFEAIRWFDRPVQRVGVTVRGEAAWRIHTRISLTEDWHCPDAKPSEYYVVSRTNQIDVGRGSWTTNLDLVRDRRNRYLGIGVGSVPIVTESVAEAVNSTPKNPKKITVDPVLNTFDPPTLGAFDTQRFTELKDYKVSQAGQFKGDLKDIAAPNLDGNIAIAERSYLRVPLVPDEYFYFDRIAGKVIPIGNDPVKYAREEVVPKLGEQSKPITSVITSTGGITGTVGVGGNAAIASAAVNLRGTSTTDGPGGGNEACVFALNKIMKAAGVTPPWGGSNSVIDVETALKQNAVAVSADQTQPGDIAVFGVQNHAGVVITAGASAVLSNSSSQRSISWVTSGQDYDRYYNAPTHYYRLK